MSKHKVTCIQSRPQPDFDASIAEATRLIEQASSDSSMLFLPEYCSGFKVVEGRFAPPAEHESSNPMLQAMRELASSRNVWIMLGSIAVPDSTDGVHNKINNRGYIIDNYGELQSHYNKIHLFDIQLSENEIYRESDIVSPGASLSVTDTPVGQVGHTICYDLRFPQLYRDLAQQGAEILTVPAAFTRSTGKAHWHALCRARAIENGAYIIAPCAVGDIPGGGGSYGHSLIINPWGEIVADGGEESGVVEATIDLAEVAGARARIPSLQHDQPYQAGAARTLQSLQSPQKSQGNVA